jgi:PKD repeat protein
MNTSTQIGAAAVIGNTYSWSSSPAGFASTVANPTVTPLGTTIYTLVETITATGCSKTNSMTVTVNASPNTSAIAGKQTPGCNESGVTYSVSLTSGSSYAWTVPSGAIITAGATGPNNNQIIVSFGTTNGDITVVETNANSCPGTTKKLSINLVGCDLNADFTGTPLTVCQGSTVTFINTSTGSTGSATYIWNFGTGATPATATTNGPHVVSYSTSGQKTVSLIITEGASKTETKTNYINVLPTVTIAAFSPATSSRCQGAGIVTTTTTATNNSAAIGYSLDAASLAGGNTINSSTGAVTYAANWSGATTITASVAGCNGPVTTTHVGTTAPTVSPVVSIAITSGSNPTCSGSPVIFTATPANGGTNPSYQWKKGSTIVGTNSAIYTDDATAAGSISVVMTTSLDCVTSTTATSNTIDLTITSPGQWLGKTSNWDDPSNWCGGVPTSSTNISIPKAKEVTQPTIGVSTSASCNNITIADGATLTIASDATGTGSLIISGTVSGAGSAFVNRYMNTDAWHIVASPVSGQSIGDFLSSNPNIAENVDNPAIRGMMDYNPGLNKWNDYFTKSNTNNLETGKGFSIRTDASSAVTFTGKLNAATVPVGGLLSDRWNCIGNPYTSAIGINNSSSSAANFLNVNAIASPNLHPSYGAIYIWDNGDGNNGELGKYTIISNTPGYGNMTPYHVQQGQAFMVLMNETTTSTSVSFTSAMQTHLPDLALKSAESAWPIIKLEATVNNLMSSTILAFNDRMTKGLDVTYDAGLLRGGSDLVLYSKLVQDNGIPFAIQALPDNDFSKMIVPIGIESKTSGEVVFSSESISLPSDCQVILEDKLNKTFTNLSQKDYKTSIAANSVIPDRFQIHTSYLTTGLNAANLAGQLTAYAIRNVEIHVKGKVSKQAVATLYDIHGRVILVKNLEEGSLNVIQTPNIKTAIYLLFVNDNGKSQSFKIPVKE